MKNQTSVSGVSMLFQNECGRIEWKGQNPSVSSQCAVQNVQFKSGERSETLTLVSVCVTNLGRVTGLEGDTGWRARGGVTQSVFDTVCETLSFKAARILANAFRQMLKWSQR